MSTPTTIISSLRAALDARRAQRRDRARLSREIAGFRSPGERLELDEILERHTAEQTREVREILARMAA
jgi:hypothetical protein